MEKPLKKPPKSDSIRKLAEFWDTHDLADFDDALQEVAEPVFARCPRAVAAISVPLAPREVDAIEQMAKAKRMSREELIRVWVLQKIVRHRGNARA